MDRHRVIAELTRLRDRVADVSKLHDVAENLLEDLTEDIERLSADLGLDHQPELELRPEPADGAARGAVVEIVRGDAAGRGQEA